MSDPQLEVYIPAEPTAAEWTRWACESRQPGEVIHALARSGRLRDYPEIGALFGVPQEEEWHPEGPVDIHTCHVLNAAAYIAEREHLTGDDRFVLLFAALTHDFGKPSTTEKRMVRGKKRWTSYDHDRVGAAMARDFLERLGIPELIIKRVVPIVECHMEYRAFSRSTSPERTLRRLTERLKPASITDLGLLVEADHSGRPPLPKGLPPAARQMMQLESNSRKGQS
jgi:tRNA nucleotidyltransferase (CCA-adding enzyme)